MAEKESDLDVVKLPLQTADAESYCRGILDVRHAETWWWQTGLAPYRGYSRPFRDHDGRWWWRTKPHFSWPMDYFTPLDRPPRIPFGLSLFGWQYPVAPAEANSKIHFNIIVDIRNFDLGGIASQKRRAVRKGLRALDIAPIDPTDAAVAEEARIVWNSHVVRTSWNTVMEPAEFTGHWRPLADMAGTTVIAARDRETGLLCAWLVTRIVEGTIFIDTIASHSDRLTERPNDALIFAAIYNAGRMAGVRHANYFLRSRLESLEKFKQSMGFDSSGIPSHLHIRSAVDTALRMVRPREWQRLHGIWAEPRRIEAQSGPDGETTTAKIASNVISVDVEDWLQSSVSNDLALTDRFEYSTRKVLEEFDRRGVKATFFILGLAAEKAPALVKEIQAAGHEIQCHGHGHRLVYTLTPDEFRRDLDRSKKLLEDMTGCPITGYRAPSFCITLQSLWALDVLVESGFKYDSSVFPLKTRRYGVAGAPWYPHKLKTPSGHELIELPVASFWWMGRRVPIGGGGYIRLFPYSIIRRGLKQINAEGYPATIYMHPYEFDDKEFAELDYPVSWPMKFHQGMGRRGFPEKIGRMLGDFSFGPMRDAIPHLGDLPSHEHRCIDRG